jgi:hypothetical protein
LIKIDTLPGNGSSYSKFLAAHLAETQSYANSPEYLGPEYLSPEYLGDVG